MGDLFLLDNELLLVPDTPFSDDFLNLNLKAKDLSPQIDWIITQRKRDYLDKLLELYKHKSIQVRRKVATGAGALGDSSIIQRLKEWQVHESDRQTWLILESTLDQIQRRLDGKQNDLNVRVYTVSEAISQIKRQISEKVYLIEGEISEPKLFSSMYYFGLKDKEDVRLDIRAFVGKVAQLGFPLNEGLTVRVWGKFNLGKNSRVIFDLEKMELTGEGELLRNLKLLEIKLEKMGLFDQARKRQLKAIPQKILLIASPNSAALTDFQKVLEQRIGGREIYFLPIKTQGVGAEFEILEKLKMANHFIDKHDIDTVVLTRGGGSKDDLMLFNSEQVVLAIHALKKPTIVAIGHERDLSLAEMVADVRASTPSQAAEICCLSRDSILSQTSSTAHFLQAYFYQKESDYQRTSLQLWNLILRHFQAKIIQIKEATRQIDRQITGIIFGVSQSAENTLNRIKNSFQNNYLNRAEAITAQTGQYILDLENALQTKNRETSWAFQKIEQITKLKFQEVENNLKLLNSQINLHNPKNILEKGYTLIWQNQKLIDSKAKLNTPKPLEIEFSDGKIEINPGRI